MSLIIKVNTAAKGNYGGTREKIKYIVVHYTANNKDTAKNNAEYFKNNIVGASAHFFVDENEIYQSVPDYYAAYSVGGNKYPNTKGAKYYGKCTNENSISVELCDSVNSVPQRTEDLAVKLIRNLMAKHNVPISRVIRHYDVNGKICPKTFVKDEKAWNEFKERLKEVRYKTIEELPEWGKEIIEKLVAEKKIADGNNLDLSEDMLRVLIIMNR